MRNTSLLWLAALAVPVLVACGSDEDTPPPPPPPPPPAAAAKPAGAPGSAIQARLQIEQRVVCPEIEKATGPACQPDVPSCDPGLYCLPVTAGGTFCEPCPERQTIRHRFADRDFVADQVRDPFYSYVIAPAELTEKTEKKQEGPCNRPEQFIATNYSYLDLKLVGIVSQGTRFKALMMDRGNVGRIVHRGDCVGKEKAVVKDIGAGYVTFVIQGDEDARVPQPAQEYSVQLHPKTIEVESQPAVDTAAPSAPVVAPPGVAVPGPQKSP
jgi:hypothetical protein